MNNKTKSSLFAIFSQIAFILSLFMITDSKFESQAIIVATGAVMMKLISLEYKLDEN